MFEHFSVDYEKGFRIFFTAWAIIWSVVNVVTLISNYVMLLNAADDQVFKTWIIGFGNIIALAVGILTLLIMGAIASKIRQKRTLISLPFLSLLVFIYYTFNTSINLFVSFTGPNPIKTLAFQSLWLLPTVIVAVLHGVYIFNLSLYNFAIKNPSTNPEHPFNQ